MRSVPVILASVVTRALTQEGEGLGAVRGLNVVGARKGILQICLQIYLRRLIQTKLGTLAILGLTHLQFPASVAWSPSFIINRLGNDA